MCNTEDTSRIEIRQGERPGEQPTGGLTEDEKQAIKERNEQLEQQGRKICNTCGIEQELEPSFSKQQQGRSHFAQCKKCANTARNERRRSRDGLAYTLERGYHRAKKQGLPAEKITRAELLEHWDDLGINPWECFHTGVPLRREPGYPNSRTIDHVEPLSAPDSAGHVIENVVPCSRAYNNYKRATNAVLSMLNKDTEKFPGLNYTGATDKHGNPLAPALVEWSEGESPAIEFAVAVQGAE